MKKKIDALIPRIPDLSLDAPAHADQLRDPIELLLPAAETAPAPAAPAPIVAPVPMTTTAPVPLPAPAPSSPVAPADTDTDAARQLASPAPSTPARAATLRSSPRHGAAAPLRTPSPLKAQQFAAQPSPTPAVQAQASDDPEVPGQDDQGAGAMSLDRLPDPFPPELGVFSFLPTRRFRQIPHAHAAAFFCFCVRALGSAGRGCAVWRRRCAHVRRILPAVACGDAAVADGSLRT